ncbi:hypoxanthine oxidase [Staphylococcus phage PMBT8]|nr:hypoxanthine oxidase [Staphylococcus phage PMBT8]
MPKRKTHNQFIIEVKEKFKDEYTVLGEYKKASEKILVKHNKCNKEYYVRASAFLSGARCPHCYKPV